MVKTYNLQAGYKFNVTKESSLSIIIETKEKCNICNGECEIEIKEEKFNCPKCCSNGQNCDGNVREYITKSIRLPSENREYEVVNVLDNGYECKSPEPNGSYHWIII